MPKCNFINTYFPYINCRLYTHIITFEKGHPPFRSIMKLIILRIVLLHHFKVCNKVDSLLYRITI